METKTTVSSVSHRICACPAVILVLIVMTLNVGCSSGVNGPNTTRDRIARFGQPDLISDQAGDTMEIYRPGTTRPVWPHAVQTFYYLDQRRAIEFSPDGSVSERAIDPPELGNLRQHAASIDARMESTPR